MVHTAAPAPDPDHGEWRQLSAAERRAIARILGSPELQSALRQVRKQQDAWARQLASAMAPLANLARPQVTLPLQQMQQQIAQLAVLPLLQLNREIERMVEPARESVAQLQRQLADSLNVALLPAAARMQFAPEVLEALDRVKQASAVHVEMPSEDGLRRLSELLDSGDLDSKSIECTDEEISADATLSMAVDQAVDALARNQPWLSRDRARQVVVVWIYLMWSAAILGASLVPGLAAIPAAFGLDSKIVAQAAGRGFDRMFPTEGSDSDEQGEPPDN